MILRWARKLSESGARACRRDFSPLHGAGVATATPRRYASGVTRAAKCRQRREECLIANLLQGVLQPPRERNRQPPGPRRYGGGWPEADRDRLLRHGRL